MNRKATTVGQSQEEHMICATQHVTKPQLQLMPNTKSTKPSSRGRTSITHNFRKVVLSEVVIEPERQILENGRELGEGLELGIHVTWGKLVQEALIR